MICYDQIDQSVCNNLAPYARYLLSNYLCCVEKSILNSFTNLPLFWHTYSKKINIIQSTYVSSGPNVEWTAADCLPACLPGRTVGLVLALVIVVVLGTRFYGPTGIPRRKLFRFYCSLPTYWSNQCAVHWCKEKETNSRRQKFIHEWVMR